MKHIYDIYVALRRIFVSSMYLAKMCRCCIWLYFGRYVQNVRSICPFNIMAV